MFYRGARYIFDIDFIAAYWPVMHACLFVCLTSFFVVQLQRHPIKSGSCGHSFNHSLSITHNAYPLQGHERLEPIQADIGRVVGYTPDMSPVHRRAYVDRLLFQNISVYLWTRLKWVLSHCLSLPPPQPPTLPPPQKCQGANFTLAGS